MSTVLPDLMFDGVITGPVHTMDIDLLNCSINNLTPLMQTRIARSIGLDVEQILMIREPLHRPFTNNLLHYYCSLQNRLANTFHIKISLVPVFPDGNCLYRALSHIIFGTESKFEMLKQHLIGRFMSIPEHFPNVMEKSGLFSEQELHEHVQRISAPYEWGTDVQLRMLGALAGIDVVSIIATDSDCNNWRLDPVYIHGQLTSSIVT